MVDGSGESVDPADPLVERVGHVEVARLVELQRPGSGEAGLGGRAAVAAVVVGRGVADLAAAGHGADDPVGVDRADPLVERVGDPHGAGAVDADAPVEVEHGPGGRAAVAGEARLPGAGEGRDDPGAGVDAPDPVHLRFGEEDGAVGGQGHRAGFGQPGPGGRAAVAALARLAGAGDRADDPRAGVDDADLVVAGVGDDEVPGPVEDDALRPVDRGLVGRAAVAAVAVVAALA